MVYEYDVENKMQSSQWMGKGFPRPKNTDESYKDQGDNGCFLIGKALSIMRFTPRGRMLKSSCTRTF